jgi:hypothetical protein
VSARATERLIGDVVTISAFPKSPQMVVQAANAETKIITKVWFTGGNEYQEGTFPAVSLNRVEANPKLKAKPAFKGKQHLKKKKIKNENAF